MGLGKCCPYSPILLVCVRTPYKRCKELDNEAFWVSSACWLESSTFISCPIATVWVQMILSNVLSMSDCSFLSLLQSLRWRDSLSSTSLTPGSREQTQGSRQTRHRPGGTLWPSTQQILPVWGHCHCHPWQLWPEKNAFCCQLSCSTQHMPEKINCNKT